MGFALDLPYPSGVFGCCPTDRVSRCFRLCPHEPYLLFKLSYEDYGVHHLCLSRRRSLFHESRISYVTGGGTDWANSMHGERLTGQVIDKLRKLSRAVIWSVTGLKSMFARTTEELKACRHLRYRARKSAPQSTDAHSTGPMFLMAIRGR